MLPETDIARPFVFNLLKHHICFAGELFRNYRKEDEDALLDLIKKGGNLWCDYYFGKLSPEAVIDEISDYLKTVGYFEREKYLGWISGYPRKFRNIFLTDGSEWTLLAGTEPERHIHIHPARYSQFTVRARFAALKTSLLSLLFYGDVISEPDYEKINYVRQVYIDASPIKTGGDISHLKKINAILKQAMG